MKSRKQIKRTVLVCDLLFLIMQAPRTRLELKNLAGPASVNTITKWVSALHEFGIIYVQGYRQNYTKPAEVFAIQPSPFFHKDAVREKSGDAHE